MEARAAGRALLRIPEPIPWPCSHAHMTTAPAESDLGAAGGAVLPRLKNEALIQSCGLDFPRNSLTRMRCHLDRPIAHIDVAAASCLIELNVGLHNNTMFHTFIASLTSSFDPAGGRLDWKGLAARIHLHFSNPTCPCSHCKDALLTCKCQRGASMVEGMRVEDNHPHTLP